MNNWIRRPGASVHAVAMAVLGCAVHGELAVAGAFPYVAYVTEANAYVRSGPGSQNYATGQLPLGFAVEVYRHDGEGWCAIRPPQGSFSLVPAHQVRLLDAKSAEVVADGVVARTGSGVGPQMNAVQVMLKRGERLEVLELPAAGSEWVKIAPPAGEFRWIAARRLSRTPPVEGAASDDAKGWRSPGTMLSSGGAAGTNSSLWPSDGPVTSPGGSFAHLEGPLEGSSTANVTMPSSNDPQWNPNASHSHPSSTPSAIGGSDVDVIPGSPAAIRLAQYEGPAGELAAPPLSTPGAAAPQLTSSQPRIRFRGYSAGGLVDDRVAEFQLRLSQVVVEPPGTWQLASLREETAGLLATESSAEVRDQLRDVLERIATFEAVQARYTSPSLAAAAKPPAPLTTAAAGRIPPLQTESADVNAEFTGNTADVLARVRSDLGREVDDGITPTPGENPTVAERGPATEALYDAVGTLKPVVSRRAQAPQFALVDDHGDVVTFITATTDVNLQPYVGKRIGVRGSRGFMPEYRRAHVTASRVTPLEEKLVK
jgi:hypothetical protein